MLYEQPTIDALYNWSSAKGDIQHTKQFRHTPLPSASLLQPIDNQRPLGSGEDASLAQCIRVGPGAEEHATGCQRVSTQANREARGGDEGHILRE